MEATVHLLLVLTVGTVLQSNLSANGAGCPDITYCSCQQKQKLWCKGPAEALDIIVEGLASSPASRNITMLDLDLSNLTVVPANFFDVGLAAKMPHLKLINIANGPVSLVEDGAFSGVKTSLHSLSMSNNSLHGIPVPVTKLRSLEQLDLSKNFIRHFQTVGNMWKNGNKMWNTLTNLDLSHNLLANISEEYLPKNLQTLKLNHNNLTLEDVGKIRFPSALQKLELSHNKLGAPDNTHQLTDAKLTKAAFNPYGANSYRLNCSLNVLDMSYNFIRQIGRDPFRNLPHLDVLKLQFNLIETLDPRTFQSVTSLTKLDLSYNKILDLTSGVFEPLIKLTTLDLSGNALQVLDTGMTLGLVRLSYLDLKNNDIIRVENNSLAYCHSLTTLTLTGNPLDCTCKLSDFQHWIKTSPQLDRHSKEEAKCRTPTKYANAALFDIEDLTCDPYDEAGVFMDEREVYRQAAMAAAASADVAQNSSLVLDVDDLDDVTHVAKLRLVRPASSDLKSFTCQQLRVFCQAQQVYNKSLSCQWSENSPEDSVSTMDLDTSALKECSDQMHLVCIDVRPSEVDQSADSEDSNLVSGCAQLYLDPIDYRLTLVKTLRATLHVKTKTLTTSYQSVPPPSFYNKDGSPLTSCVTKAEVVDDDLEPGDHVVKQRLYGSCNVSDIRFDGIFAPRHGQGHLRLCVSHVLTYSQEIDTRKSCENVLETMSEEVARPVATPSMKGDEAESLLPLVLTLVFLCVGIVALTVLYLICKGCLRDRREVGLTTSPGFHSVSSNPFYGDNNNSSSHYGGTTSCGGLVQNIQRTLWFICPLSIFKGRRRHGPYSDELFLDDDDNCTEMSHVGK